MKIISILALFCIVSAAHAADFYTSVKSVEESIAVKKSAIDSAYLSAQSAWLRRAIPLIKKAPLPVLGADPRASEKEAHDLIKKRNDLASVLADNGSDDAEKFRILRHFYSIPQPGMPVMPEFIFRP